MTPTVVSEGPQVTQGTALHLRCLPEAPTFLPPEGGGSLLRAPGNNPNKGPATGCHLPPDFCAQAGCLGTNM